MTSGMNWVKGIWRRATSRDTDPVQSACLEEGGNGADIGPDGARSSSAPSSGRVFPREKVRPRLEAVSAAQPVNEPDGPAGALLASEEPGLQVLADSAYGSAETRAKLRQAGHDQAIKAIPLRPA